MVNYCLGCGAKIPEEDRLCGGCSGPPPIEDDGLMAAVARHRSKDERFAAIINNAVDLAVSKAIREELEACLKIVEEHKCGYNCYDDDGREMNTCNQMIAYYIKDRRDSR